MLPPEWTGEKSETVGIEFSGPSPPPRSSMAAIIMPSKSSEPGIDALRVLYEEMTECETVIEEEETTVAGHPALRRITTRDYPGQGERKGVRYLIAVDTQGFWRFTCKAAPGTARRCLPISSPSSDRSKRITSTVSIRKAGPRTNSL